MSILVFAHVYGVKYGQEYFAKLQIKKQFGTYLSPAMVQKLQDDPTLLRLGGETRKLTSRKQTRGGTRIHQSINQWSQKINETYRAQ